MIQLRLVLLLLSVVVFQTGCSTPAPSASSLSNVDANGNTVSSVPWNKPESWESQGQLGGMTR